jgi:hypothetical protein
MAESRVRGSICVVGPTGMVPAHRPQSSGRRATFRTRRIQLRKPAAHGRMRTGLDPNVLETEMGGERLF